MISPQNTNANADDEVSVQLAAVARLAAGFLRERANARVSTPCSEMAYEQRLEHYDFDTAREAADVAADVFDLLGNYAVRSDHPMYFGLFNPPALPAAIIGDLIAATINPQLAVYSHAPAAAAIESKVLRFFGSQLGWPEDSVAGTFTSGGSEANHTALLAALARRYPGWAKDGLQAISTRPAIYASEQSHLAWIKIARSVGLGTDAVRLVPTSDGLSLDAQALERFIGNEEGRDPVLVVATAGTTAHGAIDDIRGMTVIARRYSAHMHVDAAWAGSALLVSESRQLFDGIEAVDSVTIDAHKWLSVPMGAGMYLARDWMPLQVAFGVRTSYMPSASQGEQRDAYIHSLQWSRRFIGLKLFMALATLGQHGYAAIIRKQQALGDKLREGLVSSHWRIVNNTALPLICFVPDVDPGQQDEAVRKIETLVVASGKTWISSVALRGRLVLRACITSYQTTEANIETLVELLGTAREECLRDIARCS